MISAEAPASTPVSATSGVASTFGESGSGSVDLGPSHSHCTAGENTPGFRFDKHGIPGGTELGTQTGMASWSLRHVASQQYVSFWQSACAMHVPLTLPHLFSIVHTYSLGSLQPSIFGQQSAFC